MSPAETIATARMLLRPLVAADLDLLVELDSDPEVMRYVNHCQPNSRELYERELLGRMLAYADQPYGFFVALDRRWPSPARDGKDSPAREGGGSGQARDGKDSPEDPFGEFLGWFHLRPSVFDASMLELGYRLRRSAWGQGLATEGSLALLERAFFELDQHAVDACADPRNAASIAVMVKCGMTRVGEFVHPRADIEVVRYLVAREHFSVRAGT